MIKTNDLKTKYINLEVFWCKEIIEPKQENQHRRRSPMPEKVIVQNFILLDQKPI